MNGIGYAALLGALGVGTYFGINSLTGGPGRSDEENIARAKRKFTNILVDTLALPGLALSSNLADPATAQWLNRDVVTNGQNSMMGQIYAGQITSNQGERLNNEDRQWLTTAAARNNTDVLSFLKPVQYSYGSDYYQPFGNYPTYDYGNFFGNQGYGYNGYSNSYGNYGYTNPSAAYLTNNSFYGNPYPYFNGPQQYAYYRQY